MSDINGKLYNKDRPHKINSKQGNRITTSIRENNCNMTWDKKSNDNKCNNWENN